MLEFIERFPLTFWDLLLWLAVNAIIILIASEILQSLPGKRFKIAKKRLNMVALVLGLTFMVMVSWQAYQTWTTLQP